MYYSRRSLMRVVIVVILFMVLSLGLSYYFPKTYNVIVTGKEVKSYNGNFDYFVYVNLNYREDRTFNIESTSFKSRLNSLNVYAGIEVGKTYEIKVIGWQIPLLKKYENITTFSTIEFLYYNY